MEIMVVFGIKIKYVLPAAAVVLLCRSVSFAVGGGGDSTAIENAKKPAAPETAVQKSNVKQIVFEEQKIEGKIRRPQLVLIKADQRPEFAPMVMQTVGKAKYVAVLMDENLIKSNTNTEPFKFVGTKVKYAAP
jgi:hypothetical protein